MAGGIRSGKGFVKDQLPDIEGYTFQVDILQSMVGWRMADAKKVKDELGLEIKEIFANQNDPQSVSRLHEIIAERPGAKDERLHALYVSIISGAADSKPNLILDVTLKDLRKLDNLARGAKALGYGSDKIHLVWVVDDIEVAREKNATSGTVQPEILSNIHVRVAETMHDILNMGKEIRKYMDGDLFIALNAVGLEETDRICVKRSGMDPVPFAEINKDVRRRIASYVPKGAIWE
jgi:hypothetical protein